MIPSSVTRLLQRDSLMLPAGEGEKNCSVVVRKVFFLEKLELNLLRFLLGLTDLREGRYLNGINIQVSNRRTPGKSALLVRTECWCPGSSRTDWEPELPNDALPQIMTVSTGSQSPVHRISGSYSIFILFLQQRFPSSESEKHLSV